MAARGGGAAQDRLRQDRCEYGSTARGARTEDADPNSAEVQHLATVAQPLVRRLNDDQRGEVRSMAFVMGLERLAYAL